MPFHPHPKRRRAFTLVELVMVVSIIGVISAIAVPRMANATVKASGRALEATLANVRKAIDCYYAEHDRFPGYNPSIGSTDGDWFVKQLLEYSDRNGFTNPTLTAPFLYGPYLRSPFPKNPINKFDTVFVKAQSSSPDPAGGAPFGWIAVLSNGDFGIFATDAQLDDIGIPEPIRKDNVRIK